MLWIPKTHEKGPIALTELRRPNRGKCYSSDEAAMETTLPISNRETYYRELVTQVIEGLRIQIEDN